MCPPGVDQTMRSAQVWYFLAPEVKQAFQPRPAGEDWYSLHSFKMSDMLFDSKNRFDAWSLLARPVKPAPCPALQFGSLGDFDVLSNEILEIVIGNIEDKSDAMALALCCEGFWQIMRRHILLSYMKAAAPWAGTKIAFQGSYCYDLPTPFQEDGLLERLVPEQDFGRSWSRFRRFFWKHENFDKPVETAHLALSWLEAARSHENSGIPPARWSKLQNEIGCQDLYPKDRSWVLRNLTLKEFVSSETTETRRLRNGKGREPVKFADVLMMNICWTTHASRGDDHLGLHRGVWAGHRFDIVTSEVHSQEENADDWRDITDKVQKELSIVKTKLKR
jgi:hypothetical protein